MDSSVDLRELSSTSSNALKIRFNDPFIGSYFISFIVYNWKILVYVLSGLDPDIKVKKIEMLLLPDIVNYSSNVGFLNKVIFFTIHPFVAPLIFSLILLIAIPKYCRPIYKWILNQRVMIDNVKHEAEQLLITNEVTIKRIQNALDREVLSNNELRSTNESKDETIRLLKIQNSDLINDFSKIQEDNLPFANNKKEVDAFTEALIPSPALSDIVGTEPLPRTLVVSKMWEYIKKHKLQNPKNKRNIIADEKLFKIFEKDEVSMFELTGLVSKHLSRKAN